MDPLGAAAANSQSAPKQLDARRLRQLQIAGILSGFSAGAWLGAAEAPTKLVSIGISPVIVSLLMVAGVFLARWSLPALIRGTAQMRLDARQAPHLIRVGRAGRLPVGCRQYAHHFRHSQYRPEHRVSLFGT